MSYPRVLPSLPGNTTSLLCFGITSFVKFSDNTALLDILTNSNVLSKNAISGNIVCKYSRCSDGVG